MEVEALSGGRAGLLTHIATVPPAAPHVSGFTIHASVMLPRLTNSL